MYFEENHAFICMVSRVIQNPIPGGATIRKTKAQHNQDRPAPFLAGHLLLLAHVTLGGKSQGSWVSWPLSPDPGQLQAWRLEAAHPLPTLGASGSRGHSSSWAGLQQEVPLSMPVTPTCCQALPALSGALAGVAGMST